MAARTLEASGDFVASFNACSSPKQCLALVEAHGLSCDAFCRVMHPTDAENSTQPNADLLGQCLGHHHVFWQSVAMAYAMAFPELTGLDIVAALRLYLFHFRLPGESGPIGRILEGFAKGFVHFNPPFDVIVRQRNGAAAADAPSDSGPEDDSPGRRVRLGDEGFKHVDPQSVGW